LQVDLSWIMNAKLRQNSCIWGERQWWRQTRGNKFGSFFWTFTDWLYIVLFSYEEQQEQKIELVKLHRRVSLAGCGLALLRKVLRFESSYVHVMAGLRRVATEPVVRLLFAVKVDVITSTSVVTRMWRLASWCHKVTRRRSVCLLLPRSSVIRWCQQVTWMWRHPSHLCLRQYHRCCTQSTRWWIYMLVLVSVGLSNYYGSS